MERRPPTAAVAAAVGEPMGSAVTSGTAELVALSVPGLAPGVVWVIRDDSGRHAQRTTVGLWPDGSVRVLSNDPAAWADLMSAMSIRIGDPDTALGYVLAFLEATRDPSVPVRPVDTVAGMPWRPGSDAEEDRKRQLLANPPDLARRTSAIPGGFEVSLALVVGQRLQRNDFTVWRDGAIDASYAVLADELPFPIVL